MAYATATRIDKGVMLDLYRTMQLVRKAELQLAKSHQRGLVHGACHTYVGQEAIAAGVCAHLQRDDVVFSTHRGHGHALAKGVPPTQLFAELYGRSAGCSGGRGGSMHLFAPEVGLMGTSGIVGPCILQATGAGYSFKLLKSHQVAVAFFGDGAVNNGAFHEGLNMASIWKLPVLFICENNGYATEVPFRYASGNPDIADRAAAYGLPGIQIDGNDVLGVYQAAEEAVQRARRGGGATLIECKTYRTRAHAEGMADFTYRTREEVDAWKERCAIRQLREMLLEEKLADESELHAIDIEIDDELREAHSIAEKSDYPDPATACRHVYFDLDTPSSLISADYTSCPTNGSCDGGSLSDSGKLPRKITFAQATLEALSDAMKTDPTIFVMGEGVGERGGNFNTTTGLFSLYGPERLCDTPICERGFVGVSAGAAMTGTRPVIDFMFADFLLDAAGEIINQLAKMHYMSCGRLKMPVLLRGCIGIGHSAATHHSGNYYPMYGHFPGLRVVVPSTPYDAKGLLCHALRANEPVLFLEHREIQNITGVVPAEAYEIPFGQAAVVCPGHDVTVVAVAHMVHRTLAALPQLQAAGISVEIIDPRTVAPLDTNTIRQSVAKTGRLLIVDEDFSSFGLGAEVAAQIIESGFDDLDAPIRRLNGTSAPTPYSPVLEKVMVPQVDEIVRAIVDLINE